MTSRHDQGPPGMNEDGEVNTLGPDGKPTHPVKIYMPTGEVLTAEDYAKRLTAIPDVSALRDFDKALKEADDDDDLLGDLDDE